MRSVTLIAFSCLCVLAGRAAGDGPTAPGGAAAVDVQPECFTLAGMQEGRQLLVSGPGADNRPRDLTRKATYRVSPAGIVRVTPEGYVRPASKGAATITVEVGGRRREVRVVVGNLDEGRPLHFANDIVPLLSRHGCNAGGCHGRASGQNGFRLSLFGFDPAFDYSALVHDSSSRRPAGCRTAAAGASTRRAKTTTPCAAGSSRAPPSATAGPRC
jgi:hypothetical protein